MKELIITNEDKGVLTVTINRLAKKNALTSIMYQQLTECFQYASQSSTVRCLVIQGDETCFCAGNDYLDFIQFIGKKDLPAFEFIKTLANFDKPLLAAVGGAAVGIGSTLLLHCDMVFSTPDTIFIMPFTQLGICLEAGASLLLPMKIGANRAFEFAVLGHSVSSEQALDFGIINKICPSSQLIQYANEQANKIAALPTDAIMTSKRLLKAPFEKSIMQAIDAEEKEILRLLSTPDCQVIMNRFTNKQSA